jgi:hypothetical protein
MIHIITVHWKDDKWIDIQKKYLVKHINEPFRIYAFLNYLSKDYSGNFFYTLTEPITSHPIKLNLLAEIAQLQSDNENDVLIFIDGDAFPIKTLMSFVYEKLGQYPLIAVQRKENNSDIQPHPLFCATRIGFWKQIKGDWKKGYRWKNSQGTFVTDVGANLLKILQERKINWYPLLRSNINNLHPVFFGIYDNVIYHHGAGFREAVTRLDESQYQLNEIKEGLLSQLIVKIPMNKFTFPIISTLDPYRRAKRYVDNKNSQLSNVIFEKIKADACFYQEFL